MWLTDFNFSGESPRRVESASRQVGLVFISFAFRDVLGGINRKMLSVALPTTSPGSQGFPPLRGFSGFDKRLVIETSLSLPRCGYLAVPAQGSGRCRAGNFAQKAFDLPKNLGK